jgi:hypothetical protein
MKSLTQSKFNSSDISWMTITATRATSTVSNRGLPRSDMIVHLPCSMIPFGIYVLIDALEVFMIRQRAPSSPYGNHWAIEKRWLYCKSSILKRRSTRIVCYCMRSGRWDLITIDRVRTVAQDMAVEIMIPTAYKIDRIAEVDFRAPIEQRRSKYSSRCASSTMGDSAKRMEHPQRE